MVHEHLHRRHGRDAQPHDESPFDKAASAIANVFGGNDQVQQASTIVSIVYVTASKTFTGAVGGYSTLGPVVATTSTPSPPDEGATNTGLLVGKTTSSSSGMPTAITPPKTSVTPTQSLLADTSISSSETPTKSSTISAASATSSATTSSSSGGMSTAGKAGLAIGILLLIGAVLSVILFCFKKRRERQERLDDEKHEFGDMNRQASQRTTVTAPRLSLRPVTQFLPNLGEKRQSRGNALNMGRPIAQQNVDRPMTAQSNNRENPFGNHAETIDATNARGPEVVQGMGPGGEVLTGATAAAAVVGLTRGASKRGFGPSPIDLTKKAPFAGPAGPPSPAPTEFSVSSESSPTPAQTASGAAIAAAGGPINSAVHRVQLDFKPSMDDELELRAGQLIRLLHEYDDGWALCIRLDRSQQGVAPRTCLSTRPVKPRPQQNGPRGPPPGMRVPQKPRPMSPAGRPMTPNGQQPRPMSPSQQRPMTPNGQHPRPMSPSQQRPMQGRPASPSQMQGRRNSPPGPSAMNPQYNPSGSPPAPEFASGSPPNNSPIGRKPVPGQAM